MDKQTQAFFEFLDTVDIKYRDYIEQIHAYMMANGFKIEVKSARSGYVVSYINSKTKKTILNYIFRKKGMLMRIYAANIGKYQEILETLPEEMKKSIENAGDCKRLYNPEACNPKCTMGYEFSIGGQEFKKCRSMAFQFLVSEENNPYLRKFIDLEVEAVNAVTS